MKRLLGGFVLAVLTGCAGHAWASGFALREYSGAAEGNAFAGASAAAEDITYMSYNPAGLTRQHGSEAAAQAVYIAPHAKFSTDSATTVLGGPTGGGNGGDDAAPNSVAPSFYYATDLAKNLRGGVAMFVPFGLDTDYEDGWAGRYHALKTEITTFDVNPVLAYKALPWLSVGGGLQIAYTRAKMSNAIDMGTIDVVLLSNAFGGTPAADDSTVELEGDDLAFGYNFGVLVELSPDTRVGAAFRSMLHNKLDGKARFDHGPVGAAIASATGQFVDTNLTAEINLPEVASFGVYHKLSSQWEIMGEAAWTNWSRMRELRVQFDNPLQADEVIISKWKDTWFLSAGATYRPKRDWAIRFGLAYDQSPTSNAWRTPRIPDQDRYWVSVGVQYKANDRITLDAGYTHMFVETPNINLTTADSNNTFRGNLAGRLKDSADILAVQARITF